MKDFYVNQAPNNEGETITSFFILIGKQLRVRRSGEPYQHLTLADSTGVIDAKLWDGVERADELLIDDYVKVRGRICQYQGRWEITVERIRVAETAEVDPSDFLPSKSIDVDGLWAALALIIEQVENEHIRQLLWAFYNDENIAPALCRAPAAQMLHHAYLGGLLDHILSLCRLASLIQQNYSWLNRDLLIAGAILHDIGKIHELNYARRFGYTTRGQLLGHISIGLMMLQAKIAGFPDFPEKLAEVLEHLVLAHHGALEHGSPVEPRIPEALALHLMDNADSKLAAIRAGLEAGGDGEWTERIRSLGRPMLRLEQYLLQFAEARGTEA